MQEEKVMTTFKGLRKMEDELNKLNTQDLKEVLKNLADARDKGDISENAEYDIANEMYNNLMRKISILSNKIKSVVIIDETNISTESVQFLTTVRLLNKKLNKEQTFSLVPETDIDVKVGKISLNSPLAKGLLGKKVGDDANIEVPAGILEFKILEITL